MGFVLIKFVMLLTLYFKSKWIFLLRILHLFYLFFFFTKELSVFIHLLWLTSYWVALVVFECHIICIIADKEMSFSLCANISWATLKIKMFWLKVFVWQNIFKITSWICWRKSSGSEVLLSFSFSAMIPSKLLNIWGSSVKKHSQAGIKTQQVKLIKLKHWVRLKIALAQCFDSHWEQVMPVKCMLCKTCRLGRPLPCQFFYMHVYVFLHAVTMPCYWASGKQFPELKIVSKLCSL